MHIILSKVLEISIRKCDQDMHKSSSIAPNCSSSRVSGIIWLLNVRSDYCSKGRLSPLWLAGFTCRMLCPGQASCWLANWIQLWEQYICLYIIYTVSGLFILPHLVIASLQHYRLVRVFPITSYKHLPTSEWFTDSIHILAWFIGTQKNVFRSKNPNLFESDFFMKLLFIFYSALTIKWQKFFKWRINEGAFLLIAIKLLGRTFIFLESKLYNDCWEELW